MDLQPMEVKVPKAAAVKLQVVRSVVKGITFEELAAGDHTAAVKKWDAALRREGRGC